MISFLDILNETCMVTSCFSLSMFPVHSMQLRIQNDSRASSLPVCNLFFSLWHISGEPVRCVENTARGRSRRLWSLSPVKLWCTWLRNHSSSHCDRHFFPLTLIDDVFRTLSVLLFIRLFSCQPCVLLNKLCQTTATSYRKAASCCRIWKSSLLSAN